MGALEMANITVGDIDQVEIIGGGVRIPKIQTLLKDFFKVKELGVHLNGDEAIVLGSAFRAANISKAFRVGRVERSVGMVDMIPFPLGVRLKNAPVKAEEDGVKVDAAANEIEAVAGDDSKEERKVWSKRVQLFKIKSHVAKRRLIKFQHDKDILCTLQYDKHSKSKFPEGVNRQLGGYHITGIEKFANGELKHLGKPKVQLSFYLDHNGILKLQKAEATLEEIIVPKEDNETNANKTEDNAEDKTVGENDKNETDPLLNDDEKREESNSTAEKDSDNKTKSAEASEKNENTTKAPLKPKKKIHRKELNFKYIAPNKEGTVLAMSADDKKKSMKVLEALQQADDERRARDLKNTLESYVFSTRSKIREHEEDLEKVSTDEEREKIMEDLEGIEDWLYEDGEEGGANAPIDAYKEKRKKMDERVNAIFFRHAELEARPKAVETARIILEAAKRKTSAWITERPQVSEDDRKQVIKMIEDIGKWLDEKEKKQEVVEKTAAPAFTSSDVKSQMRPLNRLMGN